MKGPTEKEQERVEQEAQRIREEYGFMDNMPFKGWIWEFVRRSKRYQEYFERFKQLSLLESVKLDDVLTLISEYRDIPIGVPSSNSPDYSVNKEHYAFIRKIFDDSTNQFFLSSSPESSLLVIWRAALPDHRISYNNFAPLNAPKWFNRDPISVRGLSYYRLIAPDMAGNIMLSIQNSSSDLAKYTLLDLSPTRKLGHTIYVGISTAASDRDLKKLLKEIKPYLTPKTKTRRIVDKKWKYYLIVYDLKEQKKYTYPKIASILNKAFRKGSKLLYDDTNIKYHYNQAVLLIDKGNYKEYLNY